MQVNAVYRHLHTLNIFRTWFNMIEPCCCFVAAFREANIYFTPSGYQLNDLNGFLHISLDLDLISCTELQTAKEWLHIFLLM